jgi:hypothetical protein
VGNRDRRHSMKMRRRKAGRKLKERDRRRKEGFVREAKQEAPPEPAEEPQQPQEQEQEQAKQ